MKMAFEVDSIQVNMPVNRNRFGLPDLESGVEIDDQTTNTHYIAGAPRNDPSAAKRLRASFERKYHKHSSDAKGADASVSVASPSKTLPIDKMAYQSTERFSIARLSMVICVGSLLAVCYLTIRMKR